MQAAVETAENAAGLAKLRSELSEAKAGFLLIYLFSMGCAVACASHLLWVELLTRLKIRASFYVESSGFVHSILSDFRNGKLELEGFQPSV